MLQGNIRADVVISLARPCGWFAVQSFLMDGTGAEERRGFVPRQSRSGCGETLATRKQWPSAVQGQRGAAQ
jgi:hypothetical protein